MANAIASETPPERLGPYRVTGTIGRGGMGVVYRARHESTGAEVAIKTVRGASESLLATIRREIHGLSRIEHPDIVRIVDHGIDDGLPWYAMELLDGLPMRRFWEQLDDGEGRDGGHGRRADRAGDERTGPAATVLVGTQAHAALTSTDASTLPAPAGEASPGPSPPRLSGILTLVRRLCVPLAYLHGEGMVFRDLKPDNVLVRPDGFPVLVDFGLLTSFGGERSPGAGWHRESLEVAGLASGTVLYMPPEQIRGELVDARADLYALGCILYEACIGRPPFTGETLAEIALQHLRRQPTPPTMRFPDFPADLERLILRLLQKEPRRRMGYASDVASALAALGATNGSSRRRPPARAYLYRPALAGRTEVLAGLDQLLEALEHRRFGAAAIVGPSGIGKTRIAMELARGAARRDLQVIPAECVEGGTPLHGFAVFLERLTDRCLAKGAGAQKTLLGPRGALLSLYEPLLLSLPGLAETAGQEEITLDVARRKVVDAVVETVLAYCSDEPSVMIFDDFQWADELTADVVHELVERGGTRGVPALVLLTCRSDEVAPRLAEITASPAVRRFEIAALDTGAVGLIIRDMLALDSAPPKFARHVAGQSQGNPFFVAEYLRAAFEEGILWRDLAGVWQVLEPEGLATESDYSRLPLPSSLRKLVERRLEALTGRLFDVAAAAAVLGKEVDSKVLQTMVRGTDRDFLEATAELLRRAIFEEPRPGFLRFSHEKVRELSYARIVGKAAELHRRAAEAIELVRAADTEERLAAELGMHWEAAGEPGRARSYYLLGARRAVRIFAHEEAERLYKSHLRLFGAPDIAAVRARNELARNVYTAIGRSDLAEVEHREALQQALMLSEYGAAGDSVLGVAHTHFLRSRQKKARRCSATALRLFRQAGSKEGEARAIGALASSYMAEGRLERALKLYRKVLALFTAMDARFFVCTTLNNMAAICYYQGKLTEAKEYFEQAIGDARSAGQKGQECQSAANLAVLILSLGHVEQAISLGKNNLRRLREIGYRIGFGAQLQQLGFFELMAGRDDAAAELVDQAIAIHREVEDRESEGGALVLQGRIAMRRGDLEAALAYCRAGVGLLRDSGSSIHEADGLCWVGAILRLLSRPACEAISALERAVEISRDNPALAIRLGCERGHLALCRGESAAAELQAAEGLCRKLGFGEASEPGVAVRGLAAAVAATNRGQELLAGHAAADLPESLRVALRLIHDRGSASGGS
ncbi:MAG: protein kinase [Candidatus Schekmanbacteria bacterium]|nr:protein kinase [Candidatus Schekmanbacteria bacterium]